MIDLDNQTALHFDLEALERIGSSLTKQEIELLIVDDTMMKELNLQYRQKASSTDVLSFPLDANSIEGMPLGSIVISSSYVETKALEFGHTIQDELSLLFIHGVLHLLGFDHEVDEGEMRAKEKEIIAQFDLPKSLIVRTGA